MIIPLLIAGLAPQLALAANSSAAFSRTSTTSLFLPPEKCPPCFNCLLPAFTCGNYGECNKYDGQCKCPPGWGGIDCLTPQCDSLADGDHRRPREDGKSCECKDGWGGINCNVCRSDQACRGFPLPGSSFGALGLPTDPDVPMNPDEMTCYTGGETVFNNHQFCDVTNRKIVDMLPGRPPQVTFSCTANSSTCDFQFWTAQQESFYCGLDHCTSGKTIGYDTNTTYYDCEKIKCQCVPGRFICGENGSVDISDFLTEEIKGPATFRCQTGHGCKFEEPAMNELINDIFGDNAIFLDCEGGECLHFSQVPGYVQPPKPDNRKWVVLSVIGALVFTFLSSAVIWYASRSGSGDLSRIKLPENEAAKLMADHVPATLNFSDISYTLGNRVILDKISGSVKSGQVMAIMGASGAGKSTFLDILARKLKTGTVTGQMLVNGREVKDEDFKAVVGFVDQEDTLMSTLTVYETILYSALLRLPREMSYEAKKFRTLETMQELGILGIKDSRIGDSGRRSISGGEKRRVSIACELVTSPSILFLDEPTSGLDAYNAFNVVDSLVSLARNYNRTVIFTIHQPRSNIVSLFDQLVVLAAGKLVYSGEFSKCHDYLAGIGKACPPGFNLADYLIDLTMQTDARSSSTSTPALEAALSTDTDSNLGNEELALSSLVRQPNEERSRPASISSSASNFVKRKTSQLMDAVSPSKPSDMPLSPKLKELVDAYKMSDISRSIREDNESARQSLQGQSSGELPDVAEESLLLRGRKRASWLTQFRILSGRAFKNLYRDPALLAAHYISSIGLALLCGLFFHNVTNDIPGFQNRLGIFFFTLALFGFSCLSSLGLFANERILFMRERSNGYYSTFTYFSSKVLFDILPLRLVPPIIYGSIIYGLVGLVPSVAVFWKFMLTLVLFNLTTASVVLWLSVAFSSVGLASLVGTLVMLFNLMFTGLLINRDSVMEGLQWLHTVSFFHAAFEALAVNELRYLTLKQKKFGVDLEVPAAAILSSFGLRAQSFWWPNIALLCIFFATFTTGSFLTLHYFVKERR